MKSTKARFTIGEHILMCRKRARECAQEARKCLSWKYKLFGTTFWAGNFLALARCFRMCEQNWRREWQWLKNSK